jgi:tRNA threonylcarbamoyladenosine modification (KEOPS) complex  Pcc1 subunit
VKAKATVRLKFPSEKQLETALRALKPEVKKPTSSRSRENLEKEGMFLILKIEADDTVALRATLNAYLRWTNSMINVLEVMEKS